MQLNVLFCGKLNDEVNASWDKTNGFFLRALEKKAFCKTIDYTQLPLIFRKVYSIIAKIWYGQLLVRDPLYDLLLEINFRNKYKKLKYYPDLIIHSSSICVPKNLEKSAKHVLYTDATIMGAIRYNNYILDQKNMQVFVRESIKYLDRMQFIFTFNEWTRQSLINDFSIMPEKVFNVGFGANLNPYFGEKDYSNKQILIVLRRGTEKNKGLQLLLEAFKIAYKRDSSIALAVVGTTQEVIEGVTYYEGFSREKTIELFQKASLFVMPAPFEPNGMVYVEALACKTPIMGLNRLAFPEFCGYGEYGFIVEEDAEHVANEIHLAFSNPEGLQLKGKLGQEYVLARFNWDGVTNSILQKCSN